MHILVDSSHVWILDDQIQYVKVKNKTKQNPSLDLKDFGYSLISSFVTWAGYFLFESHFHHEYMCETPFQC